MTKQIENHLSANMNMRKRNIMMANFLGGLAWGFGTVVGASVVVAIIGYILGLFGFFEVFSLPQPPNLR
ncbi:hypothetical protein HYS94_04905 [Candidatus Daviesbacteria bacterium]|nr:hypothetical protein [Candidatus Daviesbacteria bacterium]